MLKRRTATPTGAAPRKKQPNASEVSHLASNGPSREAQGPAAAPGVADDVAPVERIAVFFSWQSDLPDSTNRRLIREALREAATRLESTAEPPVRIDVDEATRNVPGSPNIPQTILDKIRDADIFVADITSVTSAGPSGRQSPNPNVLVELGFAIAHLGWGRIILLCNTSFGEFPTDVPFDIDRHRVSTYRASPPQAARASGSKSVGRAAKVAVASPSAPGLAEAAMKLILAQRPARPISRRGRTEVELRHARDAEKLRRLLSEVHLPTLDGFLDDELPLGRVNGRIFHFMEGYRGVLASSLFHLNDRVARVLVNRLRDAWVGALSFGNVFRFVSSTNKWVFDTPSDFFMDEGQRREWLRILRFGRRARRALDRLLVHVRSHYVEVDIDECNRAAWADLQAYVAQANRVRDA